MLQFQSFWVFRPWIPNRRGNFTLMSQGARVSRGRGVPMVHGILWYWGSLGPRTWSPFSTMPSRNKGNRTMKFVQLIEYNMRNIILEKSYTKCGGKTSPRPFSGKLKLKLKLKIKIKIKIKISGSIVYSFIQFVFILPQTECYRNILKLSYRPFAFTDIRRFWKMSKGLELVPLHHFLYNF